MALAARPRTGRAAAAFFLRLGAVEDCPRRLSHERRLRPGRANPAPAALGQAMVAFLGTFLTTLVALALAVLMTVLAVSLPGGAGTGSGWAARSTGRGGTTSAADAVLPGPAQSAGGRRSDRHGRLARLVLLLLILAAGFPVERVAFVLTVAAPVLLVFGAGPWGHAVGADTAKECWPEPW